MHLAQGIDDRHMSGRNRGPGCATTRGTVVEYANTDSDGASGHESVTRIAMARKLAVLKGYDFAGQYDPANHYSGPLYFVPSDTLIGTDTARALGIRTEDDLFGGVVPFPFVATKAISHPLIDPDALAPQNWSHDFGRGIREAVLFGFTAFALRDARRAGVLVLERGPARIKPARGVGGRGQTVVSRIAELEAVLDDTDPLALSRDGIVIEQNFDDITTYSVGQVRVSDLLATYYGTQSLTTDNCGSAVYGGSDLVAARGGYDALLSLDLTPEIRLILAQARMYDTAALQEFPGLIASRRNYDVASVIDTDGRRRAGVLEQSWRIGGASAAEIAALEAFRAEPTLRAVRASCAEVYRIDEAPPPRSVVHFRGIDDRVGPITKYARVEPYGDSR
jgi:Protein of unknown function (DUF3182)